MGCAAGLAIYSYVHCLRSTDGVQSENIAGLPAPFWSATIVRNIRVRSCIYECKLVEYNYKMCDSINTSKSVFWWMKIRQHKLVFRC